MASIPKLFLESSVFNFYRDGKQGQKRLDTIKLFQKIADGEYQAYTSLYVLDELKQSSEERFNEMQGLINIYKIVTLPYSDEVEHLADIYVAVGIIPAKYLDDAVHIATTTVHNLDCILSCNMGHIVKQKTMIETGFTNLREGYKWIGISSPMEVITHDERRTGGRAQGISGKHRRSQ